MKTTKNIFIAFLLNLSFSVIELFGGIFTGSVAILSDSVHDLGDAASIGLSYFFEKKSHRKPDEHYSFGYRRFSVMGGLITTLILTLGSLFVIAGAMNRLFHPTEINYNGMIILAVIGTVLNLAAAFVTKDGDSLNQKSVNLHMLEDVLGWSVVLVGSVIMRFTDLRILDPLMSIGVALYILKETFENLSEIMVLLLEKVPESIDLNELTAQLLALDTLSDVSSLHVWGLDEHTVCATVCVTAAANSSVDTTELKAQIRSVFATFGITESVIEL